MKFKYTFLCNSCGHVIKSNDDEDWTRYHVTECSCPMCGEDMCGCPVCRAVAKDYWLNPEASMMIRQIKIDYFSTKNQ